MKVKTKGKEYSEVYVIQSSDEFVQNLKSSLGEDMILYRKLDDAVFSHKIWKIEQ